MRRMEKITGRSDDMIILRGVNMFPTQIEELLMRCEGLAPHYLIELRRDQRLDIATVRVEARVGQTDAETRATQAAQLAALVKNNIGLTVQVEVADPGMVERSLGKARRVIDLRAKK